VNFAVNKPPDLINQPYDRRIPKIMNALSSLLMTTRAECEDFYH